MSGGSMDYLCFKVEEVANILANEKSPTRRAFGAHLIERLVMRRELRRKINEQPLQKITA